MQVMTYGQNSFTIQTGECINNVKKSTLGSADGLNFGYSDDSLIIKGNYSHNCGTDVIFSVNIDLDTVMISTKDTGRLATCSCIFDFTMKVKATLKDSIVIFNGQKYNTQTAIYTLETNDNSISLSPNPSDSKVILTNKSDYKIIGLSVFDSNGKILKQIQNPSKIIDISNISSGVLIFELLLDNNKIVIKKVIKK
jgi:hypothetical protein